MLEISCVDLYRCIPLKCIQLESWKLKESDSVQYVKWFLGHSYSVLYYDDMQFASVVLCVSGHDLFTFLIKKRFSCGYSCCYSCRYSCHYSCHYSWFLLFLLFLMLFLLLFLLLFLSLFLMLFLSWFSRLARAVARSWPEIQHRINQALTARAQSTSNSGLCGPLSAKHLGTIKWLTGSAQFGRPRVVGVVQGRQTWKKVKINTQR